jgi:hypothetical protein
MESSSNLIKPFRLSRNTENPLKEKGWQIVEHSTMLNAVMKGVF